MTNSDPFKEAVYSAEQGLRLILDSTEETFSIAGSTLPTPIELHFGDIENVRRYVRYVCIRERVFPEWRIPSVVESRGSTYADALYTAAINTITIPTRPDSGLDRWAMRQVLVLHEIAHWYTRHRYGPLGIESHGTEFQLTLLDFLAKYIGIEAQFAFGVLLMQAKELAKQGVNE